MDSRRFDTIARLFAERRLSRRRVFKATGTGFGAAALGAGGLGSAAAQEATPAATEPGEPGAKVAYLFVQSYQQGVLAPKVGEQNAYTLTLQDGLGQTIYFSDRPERQVGTIPTGRFLQGLGFEQENPPNAALVLDEGAGATSVVVAELTNPLFDPLTGAASYDLRPLLEGERLGDTFAIEPAEAARLPASFGPAHLFIDDCADQAVNCINYRDVTEDFAASLPGPNDGKWPFCWKLGDFCCEPCAASESWDHLWNLCQETFSQCNGHCTVQAGSCW